MRPRPGSPYPLGATWDGAGVNFAIFSEHATKVELFLMFNAHHERVRFLLPPHEPGQRWERILDTAQKLWSQIHRIRDHTYRLAARSVAIFRLIPATIGGKR